MTTLMNYFASPIAGEWGGEAEDCTDGVPVLRTTNFTADGRLSYDDLTFRAIDTEKKEDKILKPGDIIIEKSGGTPKKPVGRCVYFDRDDDYDYFCSNFTAILRANNETVNTKYLWYILQEHYKKRQCLKYQYKTNGIANLDITDYLSHIEVDLPVREIQDKRVEAMDYSQHLLDVHQEMLDILDNAVKSRFVEMFGDPVTNPMEWKSKSLLEIGDCKNGMNFHKGESGVELHCLGVGDFQNLSVIADTTELPTVSLNEMPSKDYLLQNEDIVFVRSNGNKNLVGRCVAVYPNDVPTVFSGFCIRFRLGDRKYLTTDYLLHVLKHESMRKKMTGRGANIQNLNQQILSTLDIPLPPIDLQNQFANFVAQADKSKLVIQNSLANLTELRDSLLQEYFS